MTFQLHNTLAAGVGVIEELLGVASTQYAFGELVAVANGIATKVGATGKPTHMIVNMKTPASAVRQDPPMLTTTAGQLLHGIKINGGQVVLKSELRGNMAPPILNVAAKANVTATLVVFDHASADQASDTGTVYIPELGQQRQITDDTKTGGEHVFTVTPAFTRAVTVGDTIIAVAFSKGFNAVKFDATTPALGVSTAVGDVTGGHAAIYGVDLAKLEVYTTHPDLE